MQWGKKQPCKRSIPCSHEYLLISQCDKRALKETRRIIDQFAERRGDRTWQTAITQDGLDTLRRLLRKTARKNTAVACHWIRGLDHSELLWVVGDRSRFNAWGATPTDTTQHDILRTQDEKLTGTLERRFACLPSSLRCCTIWASPARHLLNVCAGSGSSEIFIATNGYPCGFSWHSWVRMMTLGGLSRMSDPATVAGPEQWLAADRYRRDGIDGNVPLPFESLPPLAAAIGWLIVTHHRLPVYPDDPASFNIARLRQGLRAVDAAWNERTQQVATAASAILELRGRIAGELVKVEPACGEVGGASARFAPAK